MNSRPSTTRIAKALGAGVLAASMFAALTGCSSDEPGEAAPASPAATSAAPTPESTEREPIRTELVRIIDGDTIEVQPRSDGKDTGEALTVRMLGADAPALDACGGPEAMAHLDGLMRPDEPVMVTFEPSLAEDTDEDGNTLAYVITGSGITQDIGARMISEGYAAAVYPEGETVPSAFSQYESSEQIAVESAIGIWAECGAPAS